MNKLILLICLSTAVFAKEVVIYLDAMHCPLCTAMVRKALLDVDGVKSAKVSLKTKLAHIDVEENVSNEALLKACGSVGYPGELK